jgi:hypothetical protein
LSSALSGATLGWRDEIENMVARRGLTGRHPQIPGIPVPVGAESLNLTPEEVEAAAVPVEQKYAQEQARYEKAHPVLSTGAEIAGGFATGGVGAQKTAMLEGGKRLAAMAAGGGGYGALAGAGYAEEGEKTEGAMRGGTIGLGLGLALPFAQEAVSRAVRRALGKAPIDAADRKILKAIIDDDMTPQGLKDELLNMGQGATMADAGGYNLVKEVTAAKGLSGPAAHKSEQFLIDRARGEYKRIMSTFKKLMGPKGEYFKTVEKLEKTRKLTAKPLYEKAYRRQIEITPELQEIMKRPNVVSALKKSLTKAKNEGITLDPDIIDTRRLDYTKRALDDMIAASKPGSDAQRVLVSTKNKILSIIDPQNTDYAKARAVWSDSRSLQDAADAGSMFMNGKSDMVAADIAKMSEAEREFFRIGAIRAVKNWAGTTRFKNSVADRFDAPGVYERLQAVFPNKTALNQFYKLIGKEQRFTQVKNKVLAGSQTAEKLQAIDDLAAGGSIVGHAAAGNTGQALINALREGGRRMGASPRTSQNIQQKALNPDMQATVQALQSLQKPAYINPRYRQLTDAMLAPAAIQGSR